MMSGTRRIDVLLPSLFRLLLGLRTLQEASRYLANSFSIIATDLTGYVFLG